MTTDQRADAVAIVTNPDRHTLRIRAHAWAALKTAQGNPVRQSVVNVPLWRPNPDEAA